MMEAKVLHSVIKTYCFQDVKVRGCSDAGRRLKTCKQYVLIKEWSTFVSIMYNTLISALEAFALSPNEADKLTTFVCARTRALMAGKAHTVDKYSEKHNSMTNVQVLQHYKFLPVHLELMVRRLKWLKSIVAMPDRAGAMLATWLGEFEWDRTGANPWIYQLWDDLGYIAKLGSSEQKTC